MILFHLVHCSAFLLPPMSLYLLIVARSLQAGEESYKRYKHLISKKDVPFVRAASSKRVVKSARKWTQGTKLESPLITLLNPRIYRLLACEPPHLQPHLICDHL